MNKKLQRMVLAGLAGAAMAPACAGLAPSPGVTFTLIWSGNVLTLDIDAASHAGQWANATGLAALELKGFGNYTSVSVTAAPTGAASWVTSGSELAGQGCSQDSSGQGGSRLCYFGPQIALSDNMVFSFVFDGSGVEPADPELKIRFVDSTGKKVGTLYSASVPATYVTPTAAATDTDSGTAAATSTTGSASSAHADTDAGSTIVGLAVVAIPPIADQANTEPVIVPTPSGSESGAGANSAQVPEPQSIALLMAGLGLMGLVARRKRR